MTMGRRPGIHADLVRIEADIQKATRKHNEFLKELGKRLLPMADPLAVLATRLPWRQIEAAVSVKFEHHHRTGEILKAQDMFGSTETVIGAGRSNAGRPKLPIRLMASLLYLKHSFNLRKTVKNPLF